MRGDADQRRPGSPTYLEGLLREKLLLLCCGAGGVGKTTAAAALGIAGARVGRRVVVLTIDPARRLCEAVGLPAEGAGGAAPRPLAADALAQLGVPDAGRLGIWMLDPTAILDSLVVACAPDQASVDAVMENRLYRVLREVTLGVQEFAAAEAVYRLIEDDTHDLVIVDTPPARNALDFLDAPDKLSWLFNRHLIGFFLPSSSRGFLRGKVHKLINNVFSRAFGEGFLDDLGAFLATVSVVFETIREHAERVKAYLTSEAATALLITSPEAAALAEAELLRERAAAMKLSCSGYVLNRSWAYTRGLRDPSTITLCPGGPAAARTGQAKLVELAVDHQRWAQRDRALLAKIRATMPGGFAIATPSYGAVETLAGLGALATHLVQRAESEGEQLARARKPSE